MMSTPHNSTPLFQQQFSEIYQKLFSNCELVVSVPLSIKRNPTALGPRESTPNLLSKTNLKVYIGYTSQHITQKTIPIVCFDHNIGQYKHSSIEQLYDQETTTLYNFIKNHYGISGGISILCECNEGSGLGITGSISAGIAFLLQQVKDSKNTQETIDIAHQIQQILKPGSSNQDRIIASLIQGHPLILEQGGSYQGWTPLSRQRGLEYCVLIDGKPMPILKTHYNTKRNSLQSDTYENTDSSALRDGCIHAYQTYVSREQKLLHDIIVSGNDSPHKLTLAIDIHNHITGLLGICYGHNNFTTLFYDIIGHQIGITPIYHNTYGGGYLCIGPSGSNLLIQNALSTLQESYPQANIIIQSDGNINSNGGIIEQNINKSHYSEHLEAGTLIYQNNKGLSQQGSYDELLKNPGIILDTINRKCYINGIKATSDQLKSQSTTVEVLYKLLINKNNTISNQDLEPSSYSTQQNQMLGKITLPLKRLTRELFNEELIIECHGSLRHFELSLQPTTITIGYITKIGA